MCIFIVDDFIIFCKVVCDVFVCNKDVEVVGVVNDGEIVFWKIEELKLDVVIFDVEMFCFNGF